MEGFGGGVCAVGGGGVCTMGGEGVGGVCAVGGSLFTLDPLRSRQLVRKVLKIKGVSRTGNLNMYPEVPKGLCSPCCNPCWLRQTLRNNL